jgi:hypothetical protein
MPPKFSMLFLGAVTLTGFRLGSSQTQHFGRMIFPPCKER